MGEKCPDATRSAGGGCCPVTKDVLLVTPYYDPNIIGGAEISTQLIAEGLAGRCDVLTFGRADGKRQVNGVDVYEINLPNFQNLWAAPLDGTSLSLPNKLNGHLGTLYPTSKVTARYRDFIQEHCYRTIILNANETVMDRPSLWKGAHDSGARVILTLRDNSLLNKTIGNIDFSRAYRRLIRRQLNWIDAFVAPSQYMIDLYAESDMKKSDSRVIPNAVGLSDPPSCPFNSKQGVIYAGSIAKHKGIITLLEASRNFYEELELIGRGPLMDIANGYSGVKVYSWMDRGQLYRELASKKVLVLPSEWPEAFGRVLVEAVLCGTLVVGSNAGGIPEVLGYDERYIFSAGDSSDLALRVNRILRLDESSYSRELAEMKNHFERYSVDQFVEKWSAVIREACSF